MRYSSSIAPALSRDRVAPAPARSRFALRRRIFLLLALVLLVGLAIVFNYGPIKAYQESRARLDAATVQVEALSEQKAQLQQELGRLGEAAYLESLARQELTYARPGEEVYIITGSATGSAMGPDTGSSLESPAGPDAAQGAAAQGAAADASSTLKRPGLLERMLSALGDLF